MNSQICVEPEAVGAIYPDLRGRRVVITGAAGGVGAAAVARFIAQGASVYATDVTAAGLARLPDGEGLRRMAVDLSTVEACRRLVSDVEKDGGPIDILVNNAAMFVGQPFETLPPETLDAALAVNLRAPVLLAQGFFAGMAKRQGAAIVNVASVAVRTGGARDVLAYAASKGGLVVATKSLARLGAPHGVRANAVLPAAIDTPMLRDGFSSKEIAAVVSAIPLARLASADEIAAAIVFLSSAEASYITGACLDVNGGWIMP